LFVHFVNDLCVLVVVLEFFLDLFFGLFNLYRRHINNFEVNLLQLLLLSVVFWLPSFALSAFQLFRQLLQVLRLGRCDRLLKQLSLFNFDLILSVRIERLDSLAEVLVKPFVLANSFLGSRVRKLTTTEKPWRRQLQAASHGSSQLLPSSPSSPLPAPPPPLLSPRTPPPSPHAGFPASASAPAPPSASFPLPSASQPALPPASPSSSSPPLSAFSPPLFSSSPPPLASPLFAVSLFQLFLLLLAGSILSPPSASQPSLSLRLRLPSSLALRSTVLLSVLEVPAFQAQEF